MNLHTVDDACALGDDGVLGDDTCADIYIAMDASEQGTIAQSGSTIHLTEVVDHAVGDFLGVDNLHVVADASTLRHLGVDVGLDELANALLEFLVGEVLHHEGGELTIEVGEEDDVSFAHLIEHAH